MASLYLPSLNADIIDKGIATGDTGYILRTGGWMLLVTVVQIVCSIVAVYFGARAAMSFGRDLRGGDLPPGRRVLRPRGRPVRRAVADHPHHQRRAAGADARRDDLHDAGRRADHVRSAASIMALREDVGLSWLMLVCVPVLASPSA